MDDNRSVEHEKTEVFPRRVDHIYCVSIEGSDSEPDHVYIGQSVTPGRALKHFKSHNGRLLNRLMGSDPWRISYQHLSVPSAEDINIFECLAIDIVSSDYRFNSLNGVPGTQVFRPRSFYPEQHFPVKNGVYVLWEKVDDRYRALDITANAPIAPPVSEDGRPQRWWVTPTLNPENLAAVVEGIQSLLDTVRTDRAVHFPHNYFQYLEDMGLESAHSLPASGEIVGLGELYEQLGGAFIYVQINDKVFEEDGNLRSGLQPGLDHAVLKDRIEKYWDKGSSSMTSKRTLSRLLNYLDRATLPDSAVPKYLVGAVSGTKLILGVWQLSIDATEPWLDEQTGKVVLPISGAANKGILTRLIGARIEESLQMNGKGVKWIDVAP